MLDMRKVFSLAGLNLREIFKNPRAIMCGIMAFLLSFMLSEHVTAIINQYHTNIQFLELFIWCFSDSDSILFAALVLMLLLSALPKLNAEAAYLLLRTNRLTWLAAQIVTLFIVVGLYVTLLLFSSVLLGLGSSYVANTWSETATLLSYMPADSEASVKVVRRAILDTTPYRCTFDIFLLVQQYMLLLSMIQLAATMLKSRRTGVLIVLALNLTGYVLTPSRLMMWLQLEGKLQFIANLLSVWFSPLQHATYAMHTFGYDGLPSLFASNALMLSLSLVFGGASLLLFKGYQFNFSGGDGNA